MSQYLKYQRKRWDIYRVAKETSYRHRLRLISGKITSYCKSLCYLSWLAVLAARLLEIEIQFSSTCFSPVSTIFLRGNQTIISRWSLNQKSNVRGHDRNPLRWRRLPHIQLRHQCPAHQTNILWMSKKYKLNRSGLEKSDFRKLQKIHA